MTGPAGAPIPVPGCTFRLEQASAFTLEELTRAYNQARVDYLIPMPMDAARLAAYIHLYDIDLDHSWAAVAENEILGLAMLGARPGHTWVTRLGVLPAHRRSGAGEVLVRALLAETARLGCAESVLEVIHGNGPALALFQKAGFRKTRELLILRRPPGPPPVPASGQAVWLDGEIIFDRLAQNPTRPAWTNDERSFRNAGDGQGLDVDLGQAGRGWLVFRRQSERLSHFVLRTERGEPALVAQALLASLYNRFPGDDTYIENIPAADEHFPALLSLGFVEAFRRVEMVWQV